MTLYVNLAELLGTRIEQGFYRPGDRLPSVRALSVEHGVSLSTVQQAYRVLEDSGLATPNPSRATLYRWVVNCRSFRPLAARRSGRWKFPNGIKCWN